MAMAPAAGMQVRYWNGNTFQSAWIEAFTNDTTNTLSWVTLPGGQIGHPSRAGETGATYVSVSNVNRLGGATAHWSVVGIQNIFDGF